MRKLLRVWEDLDVARDTIAKLEAELTGCRKICDGLLAKDLDSSAVARAKNARLEAELTGCRKIIDDLRSRRIQVMDENVHLRKVIEDAPHEPLCESDYCLNCEAEGTTRCEESDPESCPHYKPMACDCWKSEVIAARRID
jgi:hypothetical protein